MQAMASSSSRTGLHEAAALQPLKISKESWKVKKPQNAAVAPHSPVIVHIGTPRVIHTSPQEFMSLVQQLTGKTSLDSNNQRETTKVVCGVVRLAGNGEPHRLRGGRSLGDRGSSHKFVTYEDSEIYLCERARAFENQDDRLLLSLGSSAMGMAPISPEFL